MQRLQYGRRCFYGILSLIAICLSISLGIDPHFSLTASAQEKITLPYPFAPLQGTSVGEALAPALDNLAAQSVYLDGRTVLRVTAADNFTATTRAQLITKRLQTIASQLDNQIIDVEWAQDPDDKLPVITVNGDVLLTVTKSDARLAGTPEPSLLARELKTDLQKVLRDYQRERHPEFLKKQSYIAGLVLLLVLSTSFGLRHLQKFLLRKYYQTEVHDLIIGGKPLAIDRSDLSRHLSEQQIQTMIALQRWCCRIGQCVIWGGGFFILLGLFPYTRQFRLELIVSLGTPFKILLISLSIYSSIRFGHVLIDRVFFMIQKGAMTKRNPSKRLALRFTTISSVTKHVIATLLIITGILVSLSLLGVNLGPLLAGAGIISLALSFASQSVLKDMINGFLILFEDQFGVGDVIICGDVAGFVENMNLRITQLRNEEGRLITIPNGQINIIQNLSKEWSQVDLLIPVALDSDIDQALDLIGEVAETMRLSPQWSKIILEPAMVLGVDKLDHIGATVRIWIKTLPLKQWDVAREYRRQLKIAFDQNSIHIGMPQQSLLFQNPAIANNHSHV